MSIISRYVFRQAASALLLILASLGGIIWIALALKRLNVVTNQGQDTLLLLKMTTLALPNLLAIIAPVALLIAAMHTLNRLSSDSELIILTASGATSWSVGKPLILLAFLVSLGITFTNHVGMPWSLRELRNIIVQVRTDLLTQVIQPGRFSSPETGLTFHIKDRTVNGELIGLVMHDTRNRKEPQSYLAERGQIVKQEPSAYLLMTNGHIMRGKPVVGPPEIIEFQKYAVDLDQFDKKTSGQQRYKPRETFTSELWQVDEKTSAKTLVGRIGKYRAELHERLSNPFYPFVFVLIALATAGQAKSTRQNRTQFLVIGFVTAVGVRMIGLTFNNLVALNSLYIPALYAVPLIAIVLSLVTIQLGARPRRGPSKFEALLDRLTAGWDALVAKLSLKRPASRGVGG